MVEAAWAATRTKGTSFKARYHRIAARRGKKRALIAVGHAILRVVYHVLSGQQPYRELGAGYLDGQLAARRKSYLKRELQNMGYEVELRPQPASAAAPPAAV